MEAQAQNDKQPAVPPPLPVILDHELVRRIGQGGYGQIWLVRSVLGTYRAAKVVFRNNFKSSAPYEREFRGIHTYEPVSRSHEGLVDVLQVGRNDTVGCFYYIMELADDQFTKQSIEPDMYGAKTLETELQLRSRLPVNECIDIGLALSSALAHLHRHAMIHRDIKPANIIFVEGRPKLADIGLVVDVREAKTIVGTDGFIAPEGPGTTQADIYSLGKVLYEMATGKDRLDYPAPATRLAEFSDRVELRELAKVIFRACAPTPQERFPSAETMHAALLDLKRRSTGAQKRADVSWPVKLLIGLGIGAFVLLAALVLLVLLASMIHTRNVELVEPAYATTNVAEVPFPVAALTAEELNSGTGFVVVKLGLSPMLVKPRSATKADLPETANNAAWPTQFQAYLQKPNEFKLVLPGYFTIPAARISSHAFPDKGLATESNAVVTIFSATQPQKFITTAVFKAPRRILEQRSCNAEYKAEDSNWPVVVSLRNGRSGQ